MIKMLRANAEARMAGGATLARMVLVGPVLKNTAKTVMKMKTHASGKGSHKTSKIMGKPIIMLVAETRK